MTKIIWMTDPHFKSEGTLGGLNPRVRLAAAIDHVNAYHADALCVILSGDLVEKGVADDYAELAAYLGRSSMPVYPMVGNEDDRDLLRAEMTVPADVMPNFIQFTVDIPDATLICLDTHKVGSHAGELCALRQDWLIQTLENRKDRPVYIFMHHPPMALGLPAQDTIRLENGDGFLDLLSQRRNVKHLFIGHVHRSTCGTVRGIPFATLGAMSFQAPAPQPAWDWDSFVPAAEAPHYAVLNIANGDITLQYIQFCTYETGIEPEPPT